MRVNGSIDFTRNEKCFSFGYIERHQPRISPEENFSKIEVKLLSRSNGIVNKIPQISQAYVRIGATVK